MTAPLPILHQRTLRAPAIIQGPALFTESNCRCVIHPAPPNHALAFSLHDIRIPVCATNISSTPVHPAFAHIPPRCSALTSEGQTVFLVEHVLSALAGLGITNALIELDHHELPILDGSSLPFTQAIEHAGIVTTSQTITPITLTDPIRVEHNDAWIQYTPSTATTYEYTIDYGPTSPITQATVRWDTDENDYTSRIAPARTFCLEHEAQQLSAAGLFTHLDPRDMLVFNNDGPINNTLRHPHECALHKLLDLIGDLALLGTPIQGTIRAHKSGHALAHSLARSIQHAIDASDS